ncbi:MAG: methyl-accepting chemotaxis protein [Maledivibacter sp.]|jgi:methyl-accepting chemotaxis protein|nr:methyl-accepting chemotaxis protein [Maledivibacter sp.]
MKSIRQKLIIWFVAIILVIAGGLSLISYNIALNSIENNTRDSLQELAVQVSVIISKDIESKINTIESIANRQAIRSMDWENDQLPALINETERNNYLFMGVGTPDGNVKNSRGDELYLGDREYFQLALQGHSSISNPVVSRADGSIIVLCATPIFDENKDVIGVVAAVFDGRALSAITNDVNFGVDGYAYLINGEGTIIAHPNEEVVLEQRRFIEEAKGDDTLTELANDMTNGENGFCSYDNLDGENIYVGYAPVKGTDWIVGVAGLRSNVLACLSDLKIGVGLAAFIFIILGLAMANFVGHQISIPIIRLSKLLDRLSKYDLTFDKNSPAIKYLDKKDEIGTLANAMTTVRNNFVHILKDISDKSQHVASASKELTSTSLQVSTAAEEVARTIEEISRGASDQARDTENGELHITELGDIIQKEQGYIKALNSSTNEVTKLKDEGIIILHDLVEKTETSKNSTKGIHEIIINTNGSAEKIEGASKMIKNIAEQTNLLALNAAIEAARAGDAGKGFAVVADEIRKLAEQSSVFTEEIDTIVKELTDKTGYAVEIMKEVEEVVASQSKSVELTNTKFKGIDNAIEKMKKIIVSINESSQDMEDKKYEIVSIIENLSDISKENAAGTEEASASVEEQTASMEGIANSSNSLAQLSQEMQERIDKFKY